MHKVVPKITKKYADMSAEEIAFCEEKFGRVGGKLIIARVEHTEEGEETQIFNGFEDGTHEIKQGGQIVDAIYMKARPPIAPTPTPKPQPLPEPKPEPDV